LTKKPARPSTRCGHSSKENGSDQSINPSSSSGCRAKRCQDRPLRNAFDVGRRGRRQIELPPSVLLSMIGRRRDSADLLAIRRRNSAGRFRNGGDQAHFSYRRSGSTRHVSQQMAEILGRYVQPGYTLRREWCPPPRPRLCTLEMAMCGCLLDANSSISRPPRFPGRSRDHSHPEFVFDSPLEGNGFERSVPRCLATADSVGAFVRP
jgi:hypothetical protein